MPLLVPHGHPMDDKGMAKIVDARTFSTGGFPEPGNSNQPPEMSACGDVAVCALLVRNSGASGSTGAPAFERA